MFTVKSKVILSEDIMNKENELYKNQGVHGIVSIFSVIDGEINVLLIKRKNEPFKGKWILVGGAIYNNETVEEGTLREVEEKTGITDIKIRPFKLFSRPDRSPVMRMIAEGYVALLDAAKAKIIKETRSTSNAEWFPINEIPKLGYDHEEILNEALKYFRKIILQTNIVKSLLPETFTLPALQRIYESLLGKQYDRRNFRKKFIGLGLIEDEGTTQKEKVGKPAKVYRFKENIIREKDLF